MLQGQGSYPSIGKGSKSRQSQSQDQNSKLAHYLSGRAVL